MAVVKERLMDALREHFGFDSFKGNQEKIINSILSGKDTFVIMPTGGGKSLCYQLPALMSPGCALIVSPLIALMKNQVDLVRGYSSKDNVAHFLNSTLSKAQIKKVRADLMAGKTKLLYVAPETLTKQENLDFFKELEISFIAVDEAHCISEWGHDFRPEYRRLKEMIDQINDKLPIIALTATATPKVQSDIVKNLGLNKANIFISSFNRPNLYYEIRPKRKKEQTIKDIVKFIHQHKGKSGIIYTLNRKTTEELADMLVANGIKAVAYHAGLDSSTRAQRQDMFLHEDTEVIVATIAFGMGIDKPDVRFVIHYNIPKSLENYYQETGRAGRDGLDGHCICYYSHKDVQKLEHLMRDKSLSEREMGAQLINETVAYAESAVCRRKVILHYFGEHYETENCGQCDNCRNPKEKIEVKNRVVIMLKAIQALEERFGSEYVINVITGKTSPQITTYRHDQLDVFGEGKEFDAHFWNSLMRQMMLEGLIEKDIEEYGLLKVTDKGKKFLKKPYSIMVALNHQFDEDAMDDEDEAVGETHATADPVLFEMLKELRKKVSKEKKLPPFVIFLETSLEDMATQYPTTVQELEKIQGVSKGKALRYGKQFLDVITRYVEENNITRPDDFVMKSVVNKSGMKVFIIQNIDKKIPLETIAKNKEITLSQLLDEMETIVASGTKLNIDYCLDEELDDYAQDEIMEYFKGCETSSLALAREELIENDYTLEQLKLVRIKFLVEYGN
ncbi:ATP-dependent DNA helicase RecQ [Chitinophaga terrae (ex Kim and Jung 2007)]|uniref:DNA helicase RecQ n=1 Tax=Chitinophaga terrae (ex Kim and Jung 2007) TaxID=408074 RepID=A0A1H4EAB3_9BACT|nr:DNA helicase RecQ [Chitinophaga terrae (ex Kim and Jung 2007)]SEA81983.1 ATP-dependent DNA helicase RecQ [Chitinophaga terrae (ex Kim and Jung 2007)]